MESYRKTKAIIHLGAIRRNTQRIIQRYPDYEYYMAVVKADCYGYRGNQVVQAMIDGGANCLAASLLEEGIALRNSFSDLPILLFTPVQKEQLVLCAQHNLWVTVATLEQAKDAAQVEGLQTVIRVNGGFDILGGPKDQQGFEAIYQTLCSAKSTLVGLYLHNYHTESESDTLKEYESFEQLTRNVDFNALDWVSVSNSLSLPRYAKRNHCNACRLGNILYGIETEDESLEQTFSLESQILTTFTLNKDQSVAYSRAYTATKDTERIAAIPLGFGDGFCKTNIGRDVFIHGKRFPIVAVTMDITLVRVDESVKTGDTVAVIQDNRHLDEISAHIHGATEEAITLLNKRVYREYKED